MHLLHYFIVQVISLPLFRKKFNTHMHPLGIPSTHVHAHSGKRRLQCSTYFDEDLTWVTRPDGADEYVFPHIPICPSAHTLTLTLPFTSYSPESWPEMSSLCLYALPRAHRNDFFSWARKCFEH